SELRYISEDDHIQFSKKCKPERNDILLGKAASVGKVAIVDFDLELNIWSPLALIRVNEKHDPKFVFYSFQSHNILNQIELFTNSSSQGNIGMGDIELLIFNLPDKNEQVAISEVLSDMDAEIAALEQRLEKTKAIKQGMMQQLLTGRIRLVDPGTPVEASA
ncbi:restriction endonuclease subunit S, partial [Candidatus Poseidoniales archaeon]|nr:restriction endonuclease subunit S [Candidatus Poseidoniales archaeon]